MNIRPPEPALYAEVALGHLVIGGGGHLHDAVVLHVDIEIAPDPAVLPEPPCDAITWDGDVRLRNVVLVVNDTMRRDAAGVYGGSASTPALNRLARENLYFTQAVSQAPWTKPSMASMVTGLDPSAAR